jgi:23S rRNA (guanosine2251-2'-O)-methyltransferase
MKSNQLSIVYGVHPIIEVIRAKKRKIYELYIEKNRNKDITDIIKQVPSYTKIIYCEKHKLVDLSQSHDHQSIVAIVSSFGYQRNFFKTDQFPAILCCDSIQDTKNLGALLRSAYCTNIMGVVLTDDASTDITGSVLKSSAGLAEHLFIYKVKNMKIALEEAKKNGYYIYLAASNGNNIEQANLTSPCALVIGNEHKGIHPELFKYGECISLRQKETAISYNASVAGGILLYNIATRLSLI